MKGPSQYTSKIFSIILTSLQPTELVDWFLLSNTANISINAQGEFIPPRRADSPSSTATKPCQWCASYGPCDPSVSARIRNTPTKTGSHTREADPSTAPHGSGNTG